MSDSPPRMVADVTTDLLEHNDAARGGRLPLLVCCPPCGDETPRAIGWLGRGRWVIEHQHPGGWSVRPLLAEPGRDPRRRAGAVDALAAVLAPVLAGAAR